MKKVILFGLCSLALLIASGCAANRNRYTTVPYTDSKTLAANVKTALWQDPAVNSFDIDVDVLRSSVQLSGFVDTLDQKRRAETITWSVPGVRAVDNDLIVKPTPGIGSSLGAEIGTSKEDASMLLPRVIGSPEVYFGKTVEVQGTVDTILSRNGFTISSAAFPDKPLLVMTEEEEVRNLSPGDVVRMMGELQPFNRNAVAQRLNAELEDRKFAEWMNKPALMAKEVNRIKD